MTINNLTKDVKPMKKNCKSIYYVLFCIILTAVAGIAFADAPVVDDIPDETIAAGEAFAEVKLDDYVVDEDDDNALIWTYSDDGDSELTVTIDDKRKATISVPDANWSGSETITFTATDTEPLFSSDDATFTL